MRSKCLAVAVIVSAFIHQSSFAQDGTINWSDIQSDFDAAVSTAQQELKNTDALFLFTREDSSFPWSLHITGVVADIAVDYQGDVSSIDNNGLFPVLVMDTPLPAIDASADMLKPIMRAAAEVLLDIDQFVVELYFDVGLPLSDTADPVVESLTNQRHLPDSTRNRVEMPESS